MTDEERTIICDQQRAIRDAMRETTKAEHDRNVLFLALSALIEWNEKPVSSDVDNFRADVQQARNALAFVSPRIMPHDRTPWMPRVEQAKGEVTT